MLRKKNIGQSTVELALSIPIAIFLLMLIFQGFRLNDRASQQSVIDHEIRLSKLDHGNGQIEFDGIDIDAPGMIDLLPLSPIDTGGSGIGGVGDMIIKFGAELGLNALLGKIEFLNGNTYIAGAARGALGEAGTSLIQTGTVNIGDVAWAAGTGALSSQQATKDFQGANFNEGSGREILGSTLQGGAIGFTSSKGDWKGAVAGATSGLTSSDTVGGWEEGDLEILVAAGKGALQATVSGALDGKVDGKTVLVATATSAFNTRTVANILPLTNWEGDPKQSAMFGAANAALSTAINGGNSEAILTSAATGAFYSKQISGSIGQTNQFLAGVTGAGFGAGMAMATGESAQSAGQGALQGFASGYIATNISELTASFSQLDSGDVDQANKLFENTELKTKAINQTKEQLNAAQIAQGVSLISTLLFSGGFGG